MTIRILLKGGTGALFLNDDGASNDSHASALQGFVHFVQGGSRARQVRLESTARIVSIEGAALRYQLAFGPSLTGFMTLVASKQRAADPDYSGYVGESRELVVVGWNRDINGRPYVLLNVRERQPGSWRESFAR